MKIEWLFISCIVTCLVQAQENQNHVIVDMDPSVDRLLNSWADDNKKSASKDLSGKGPVVKYSNPCTDTLKRMGYKIQVLSTLDRLKAQEIFKELIDLYSDLYPELKFESPNYKIRLGDYLSKSSYADDLGRVRQKYPYAFPVPAYVWCKRAH
ncbi:MAG: hypothetical protein ACMUEM_00175 [Flavobacteriales bacterium AspAUS03]